jgi:hypothetical protein
MTKTLAIMPTGRIKSCQRASAVGLVRVAALAIEVRSGNVRVVGAKS